MECTNYEKRFKDLIYDNGIEYLQSLITDDVKKRAVVLEDIKRYGVPRSAYKHNINRDTLYRWKRMYL